VAVAHVLQEVLDRLGRLGRVELQPDGARARLEVDLRVGGMDVVNKIVSVPTGNQGMHQNVPRTPVVIESASVVGGK
jgi:hypothetical protein